jgi:hypothetical protein
MIYEGLKKYEDTIYLYNRNADIYAFIEVENELFYFYNSEKEPYGCTITYGDTGDEDSDDDEYY